MKKLLLLLILPIALLSSCKKDDSNKQVTVKYTVTGYSYSLTTTKAGVNIATAVIPAGNGIAQTTKDYTFTATTGDDLVINYSNTGAMKVVIFTDNNQGPTLTINNNQTSTYNFKVE